MTAREAKLAPASAKREASNHFRSIGELTHQIVLDLAAKRGMGSDLVCGRHATPRLTVVTSTDEEPAA